MPILGGQRHLVFLRVDGAAAAPLLLLEVAAAALLVAPLFLPPLWLSKESIAAPTVGKSSMPSS